MTTRERLITFLRANAEWHYPGDLPQKTGISSAMIYSHLRDLAQKGIVETKRVPSRFSAPIGTQYMYRLMPSNSDSVVQNG